MTNKTVCKKPAFFNIFVKNFGKNSVFDGKIIVKNQNSLKISVLAEHLCENTGIFVKNDCISSRNQTGKLECGQCGRAAFKPGERT